MPIALSVIPAVGQSNPFYWQPLSEVKQFLQLTDSQLQTILTNNDEYNRWSSDKQNRVRQVQSEIADETGKSPLDPMALGIRYAEIEAICREMKDRANEYRTRNMDVINQDQKTKLKVLEDALKLAPVISEAQYGNLIGGFTSAPYAFTSTSLGIGGSLIGGIIGPANGCYLPFPVVARNPFPAGVVRIGDSNPALTNEAVIPAHRVSGATNRSGSANRWFDTTKFFEPPQRAGQPK
jgi:hypothetical protein